MGRPIVPAGQAANRLLGSQTAWARGHTWKGIAMPSLPSTRRKRYLYRREKYLRKALRGHKNRPRGSYKSDGTRQREGETWVMVGDGSKQPGDRLKKADGKERPGGFPPFGVYAQFLPADHAIPPVVQCWEFDHRWTSVHAQHFRYACMKFAARSVGYRGRKVGALTGVQRAAAAAVSYFRWISPGFWPAWDPEHRTPIG